MEPVQLEEYQHSAICKCIRTAVRGRRERHFDLSRRKAGQPLKRLAGLWPMERRTRVWSQLKQFQLELGKERMMISLSRDCLPIGRTEEQECVHQPANSFSVHYLLLSRLQQWFCHWLSLLYRPVSNKVYLHFSSNSNSSESCPSFWGSMYS